jgi:hypothetical protein
VIDYNQFIQLEFRLERHRNGSDHSTPSFVVWGLGADGRRDPIRELNDMAFGEFRGKAKKIIGDLKNDHPALKLAFTIYAEDYQRVEGRPRLDGRRLELRSGLIQVKEQEWLDRLAREKVQPENDGPRPANDPRK